MQISTISIKRQITLSKAELQQLSLKSYDKVIKTITKEGILLQPMKQSVVESTAGSLSHLIKDSKKNKDLKVIMSETKRIVARKLNNSL